MATPSYWAMHGLQSVLYFGRLSEVLIFECPVLIGFAALFILAAIASGRFLSQRSSTPAA
jgi:hypothetical protein